MKQYDLDALEMRAHRMCRYTAETACLIRVFAEMVDGCSGYFVKNSDIPTLAGIVVKYANRVHYDALSLKYDLEFPASKKNNKLL